MEISSNSLSSPSFLNSNSNSSFIEKKNSEDLEILMHEEAKQHIASFETHKKDEVFSFKATEIPDQALSQKTNNLGKQELVNSKSKTEDDLIEDDIEFRVTSEALSTNSRVKNLDEIKDLIANPKNPNQSVQSLLSQLAQELQKTYPGKTVIIESEFVKQDDQYQAEPFTLPPKNDKTYYKTKVIYTVSIEEEAISLPVEREIFTTATESAHAMIAAAKYKETVVQLALASYDEKQASEMKGFPTDPAAKENIMKQVRFSFTFSYDEAGKPTKLLTIYAGSKREINLQLKTNPVSVEYEYQLDLDSNKITRNKRRDDPTSGDIKKHVYYETEEEALLYAGYDAAHDTYDRLEISQQPIREQIKEFKDEIKEREKKLEDIRAFFVKEPLIKVFGAEAKISPEMETFFNDYQALKDLSQPLTNPISLTLQAYIDLKREVSIQEEHLELLNQWKGLQILSEKQKQLLKEIAELYYQKTAIQFSKNQLPNIEVLARVLETKIEEEQDRLKTYETKIDEQKKDFEEKLDLLDQLIAESEVKVSKLDQASVKASTHPESKKAQAFLKSFNSKEIERLKTKIEADKNLFNHLKDRLNPPIIQPKQVELDETDNRDDEVNDSHEMDEVKLDQQSHHLS